MPEPTTLDVLILGAGPVGLTLASELTRYGLHVRIVDQLAAPSDKSRALVVWPRTMEHLDRLGLADKFLAAGLKITHGRIFEGAKPIAEIPLDTVATPFPFALMVPQNETEALLREWLSAHGVAVEQSVTFQGYSDGGSSVTASLLHADGQTELVAARRMIGCDGAHSAVRHAIGATFEGETLPSDYVLADFHTTSTFDSFGIHFHADGLLALFPLPGGRIRAIANIHSGDSKKPDPAEHAPPPPPPTSQEIRQILDTRGVPDLVMGEVVWLAGFHINERMVKEYRRGNVFLAGDAAHIHSPAGGQGMNTGMQDAVNLAWKLALVHSGDLSVAGSETLLGSYAAERAPVAHDVLKGAGALTRVATLENSVLRRARDTVFHLLTGFSPAQHRLTETITELAVAYPGSTLNEAVGTMSGPAPGERAPVTNRNRKPVSAGDRPLFTVYAEAGPDADQLLACYPSLFDPELRPPFEPGGIWIVRPDGYVGFRGDSDAWAAADHYLGKLKWEQSGQTVKLGA